ncbi:6-hydroxy-D-nicotine oxidase [Penicillium subrubescens]|uniref:6-hydroxy-D-nicotine oxidase n=1 Tax=Penicillium subrubescens TaxID=1316194 RepID=UPI0025454F91|nr:6-hydroxy-D-nicotine oxidase [Penicillium subrubescens]KAJ5883733.1 6-hydroxy-D-nicotine oxidase [Penicillium subrubescens]
MGRFGILATLLPLIASLAGTSSIPRDLQPAPVTRARLSAAQVQRELGRHLSATTSIFGPSDDRYTNATERWNTFAVPHIQVVIEPGQERDVSIIVRYCNDNSIEFLAINGGHGDTQSLGSFNGIQINMANFRDIAIQPDGKSAWFGGGAKDGDVQSYLWDHGYVTTTGSCDCVGLLGAGLGAATAATRAYTAWLVRVNATSHSDLLWAMRGAGHNFGIVTSFEMNIFPRGPDTWHYHNYLWRGEHLEAIFAALNELQGNGTTPVDMTINFGNFLMNTTVATDEPVIFWTFAYRGSAEVAEKYLAPFNAIEAVYDESGDVPYPEISVAQQTDVDAFICGDNNVRITATAGLQVYNLTAERLIFDGFTRRVQEHPELVPGAVILHEGYSTEAVDAQNPNDSAYPFRADHHLMLFQTIIPPNNASIERAVWEWAGEVRDQWNEGQPGRLPNAYVNYANGFEPLQQMYGHEPWRLQRLKALKRKYDPANRFRYYNPIVPSEAH